MSKKNLNAITRKLRRVMDMVRNEANGINLTQFEIFLMIGEYGQHTNREIAATMDIPRASVSRHIARLQDSKLLGEGEPNQRDLRALNFDLTKEGQDFLKRICETIS